MNPAPKDAGVAIMAEGKQHALAVGALLMSTDDMLVVLALRYSFDLPAFVD